jgi:hypothetical protein
MESELPLIFVFFFKLSMTQRFEVPYRSFRLVFFEKTLTFTFLLAILTAQLRKRNEKPGADSVGFLAFCQGRPFRHGRKTTREDARVFCLLNGIMSAVDKTRKKKFWKGSYFGNFESNAYRMQ